MISGDVAVGVLVGVDFGVAGMKLYLPRGFLDLSSVAPLLVEPQKGQLDRQ